MRGIVLAVALVPLPALAAPDMIAAQYSCERGAQVPVVYVNDGATSFAALQVEGQQIVLEIAISASGARYAAPVDQPGYIWWGKGDEATLAWRDGPEGSDETFIYRACVTQQ